MKKTGLQYRFSDEVKFQWLYHYECMLCEKNQWDCLHHIVSPSSRFHKPGKHNESVLNSCPLHNKSHPSEALQSEGVDHYCHFGNETFLYKDNTIAWLLQKVYTTLMSQGYELTANDKMFLHIYKDLYLMDVISPYTQGVDKPVDKLFITC